MYADPHSCHNFYKCANGTLTFESCHDGLLFDPDRAFAGAVENHCHYNWAVQCGEREQEEDDTRTRYDVFKFELFLIIIVSLFYIGEATARTTSASSPTRAATPPTSAAPTVAPRRRPARSGSCTTTGYTPATTLICRSN